MDRVGGYLDLLALEGNSLRYQQLIAAMVAEGQAHKHLKTQAEIEARRRAAKR